MRFSMRTPVWTRSMRRCDSLVMVRMYHGTGRGIWDRRVSERRNSNPTLAQKGRSNPTLAQKTRKGGAPIGKRPFLASAGRSQGQNPLPGGAAVLDFQLAVRAVHGFAVGDGVMGVK